MESKSVSKRIWAIIAYILAGTLVLLLNIAVNPINHYISGLMTVLLGFALYLWVVFAVANKNWLDIRAVFSGCWIVPMGLAALRLANYQEPWQWHTWVCMALVYAAFEIGANIGILHGEKWLQLLKQKAGVFKCKRIYLQKREERLFAICVITTLIGLACFSANVAIKGFIPCFSDSTTAYTDFYTKFHIFSVASTGVSGLCFYTIKTQKLGWLKKLILFLCIFYLVFLFPVMVVSRGVFMVAALSLMVVVFYLYKKKLVALILSIIVIFATYLFASELRNYTEEQLLSIFEPTKIEITEEGSQITEEGSQLLGEEQEEIVIQLPPKVSFVYTYLTVGYDNFNEAVQNGKEYSYGIRQMKPFNVLLRSGWINEVNASAEFYQVKEGFNTVCFGGEFFYDLREWGICLFGGLWALVFGIMQQFSEKGKGIFSLMVLGNAMVPVALCFFDAWVSTFTHWMLWGVVLLLALATSLCMKPREKSA